MNDESSAKASRTPSSIPPIFSLRENKMRVSDGRETRRILIEHSSIAGNSHHKKKPSPLEVFKYLIKGLRENTKDDPSSEEIIHLALQKIVNPILLYYLDSLSINDRIKIYLDLKNTSYPHSEFAKEEAEIIKVVISTFYDKGAFNLFTYEQSY